MKVKKERQHTHVKILHFIKFNSMRNKEKSWKPQLNYATEHCGQEAAD